MGMKHGGERARTIRLTDRALRLLGNQLGASPTALRRACRYMVMIRGGSEEALDAVDISVQAGRVWLVCVPGGDHD